MPAKIEVSAASSSLRSIARASRQAISSSPKTSAATKPSRPWTSFPQCSAPSSMLRLTTSICDHADAGGAEAGRRGGARPEPDATVGVGHAVHGEDVQPVNAAADCRAAHVEPQHVPLVPVRAEQLLPQIAPPAVHVAIQPQNVMQRALLEQVEVFVVTNAERDADVHLRALAERRPLLEIARFNPVGLPANAIDAFGRQLEQAHFLAARLRMLEVLATDATLIGHPIAR